MFATVNTTSPSFPMCKEKITNYIHYKKKRRNMTLGLKIASQSEYTLLLTSIRKAN